MTRRDAIVIGVDSSTQSTKAMAFSASGEVLAEGRASYPLHQPKPGYVEQDPEDWWAAARSALSAVTGAIDPARIAGVAISNQRETLACVDAAGRATRPAMTWLDSRAADLLPAMADEFGAGRLHAISGKPVDLTPALCRYYWLRERHPEDLAAVHRFLDVHGFLLWRLSGEPVATWTSADPSGLFDLEEKAWSGPILAALGVRAEQMPRVSRPGGLIGRVTATAAADTGLPAGTPIFAAGGDGQCAGLGANAVSEGTVYLNLGTAVVAGVWSPDKALGQHWRTMLSPTGEGYFLESVQRGGAFLLNWIVEKFAGGLSDPTVFQRLTTAAETLPVGSDGVLVCSFLAGCMDPYWDPKARVTITGLGSEHGPEHIFRASLEAITLVAARSLAAMEDVGVRHRRIIAIGGGARNPVWLKMVADATGLPVIRSLTDEASALGAAISAAVGAGLHPDFASAAAAMTGIAETLAPDPAARADWNRLSRDQDKVYLANRR